MPLSIGEMNENEILAYLGYRGGAVDDELRDSISEVWEEVKRLSNIRAAYRVFELSCGSELWGLLSGDDIIRRLSGCTSAVVFGATIGAGIDRELMRLKITDIGKAVIFDACASAAIESAVNNLYFEFKQKYKNITDRFSPGYGDFSLAAQSKIAEALKLSSIGITLTEGGLMLPQKSVTAIFGIKGGKE